MMFEKVMIQIGVKLNLCRKSKKSRGGWGGAVAPPIMFEEVMIQIIRGAINPL